MDILLFVLFILFLIIYVTYRLVKMMGFLTIIIVIEIVWSILSIRYMDWAIMGGKARATHVYVAIALFALGLILSLSAVIFILRINHQACLKAKEKRLPGESVDQAAERIFKEDLLDAINNIKNTITRNKQ